MSKYHDAANVLKREAQRYEALSLAAAALDEIGGLDQAASEANAKAVVARKEAEQAKIELDNLKSSAAKVKAVQAEIIANANAQAAGILDEANGKAAGIVEQAKREGVRINQLATDSAESTNAQGRTEVSRLAAQRDALYIEVSTLTERADLANEAADAAEKRLAKVKAQIAQLAGS